MTYEQKRMIEKYRRKGVGYKQIAKDMGISLNSVKSYCRRNNLCSDALQQDEKISECEQCGKKIIQVRGRKHKRSCSDACRRLWWNTHLNLVKRKANYDYVCPICNKSFSVYGNAKRKYCSHQCYITGRFGGAKNG